MNGSSIFGRCGARPSLLHCCAPFILASFVCLIGASTGCQRSPDSFTSEEIRGVQALLAAAMRRQGVTPPAVFVNAGAAEALFDRSLTNAIASLPSSWAGQAFVTRNGPPRSLGTDHPAEAVSEEPIESALAATPGGRVFGMLATWELTELPPPLTPDRLAGFVRILETDQSLQQYRSTTTERLRAYVEEQYSGVCSKESPRRRIYSFFPRICATCISGQQLRSLLSNAASSEIAACPIVPADYKLVIAELLNADQELELLTYDVREEPMKQLAFEYAVVVGVRVLSWERG